MSAWPYKITDELERLICEYTGAPYCIAVDNNCNGIFLCLRYWTLKNGRTAEGMAIPKHTYIGVPYAIRQAGFNPVANRDFQQRDGRLMGEYKIGKTNIFDSALRFTTGMYLPGAMQVLSFTGPFKHLKTGKGGAIITDNKDAAAWLRRARFSGRNEVPYDVDTFDMQEGYNMYLPSTLAAHGVHMFPGIAAVNEDLNLAYPDWSVHPAFTCI